MFGKRRGKKKKQKQTSYWVPRSTSHHHILSIYQVSHDVGPIGVHLLAQWLAPLVLTMWAGIRIPPTVFWGGDLMEGNPHDLSHLRVRELWVRIVVCLIIAQM